MSRPIEHDGNLFRRKITKFWWMRYLERDGTLRRESTERRSHHYGDGTSGLQRTALDKERANSQVRKAQRMPTLVANIVGTSP